MKTVLYLGCPLHQRKETQQALAAGDVSVRWADDLAGVLRELQRSEVPVLLDLEHDAAALQAGVELRAQRAETLMFAVVDGRRPGLTTEAVIAGMADVFLRPLIGRRVANAIGREIGSEPRLADNGGTVSGDALYTHSPAMRDVMALIARAARTRTGVLIRGEEGTGRQVVAHAIHSSGDRCSGAFVSIDCAAYDTEGLDVELFGPAARVQNRGQLSRGLERVSASGRLFGALGGTLYLQHVADAPAHVQARLARLLRDREAVLVENNETVRLDVQVMAGVDPGFNSAVQEGRVREDLLRRLSGTRIDVPPLRSRREDIPPLANYLLRSICAALRVPPKTISRPALSLIAALPWRGNAAELRVLLESVVAGVPAGRGIVIEDLLVHVRLDGGPMLTSGGGTLRQARARFEREYISAVLEQHQGRISKAAKALGIQRTNLYRKLRTLQVSATGSDR